MAVNRTIDEKGRLTLGREFAGRIVQIDKREDKLVVTFCRVVPDREAWLWKSESAIGLVEAGLSEAAEGELTEGPDLTAAFAFAEDIPDEVE